MRTFQEKLAPFRNHTYIYVYIYAFMDIHILYIYLIYKYIYNDIFCHTRNWPKQLIQIRRHKQLSVLSPDLT